MLAALVLLAGTRPLAAAEPARSPVVTVHVVGSRTCVQPRQLSEMLRRGGIESDDGTADAIDVEVSGTPLSLTVNLRNTTTTLAGTRCETATDVVAAFIVSTLAPARETPLAPAPVIEEPRPDAARLEAARTAVREVDTQARLTTISGVVELGLGLGLASLPLAEPSTLSERGPRIALTNATVFALGGGVTSLLVEDDVKPAVVTSTLFVAGGSSALAIFSGEDRPPPSWAVTSYVGGQYATAVLIELGAILHQPPITRLRESRKKLEAAEPSERQVAEAERDIQRLAPAIPRLVTYAPLVVGGLLATIPAMTSGFDDWPRNGLAALGCGSVFIGTLGMFMTDIPSRHRASLREAGITDVSFGPGPADRGGFSISGRF